MPYEGSICIFFARRSSRVRCPLLCGVFSSAFQESAIVVKKNLGIPTLVYLRLREAGVRLAQQPDAPVVRSVHYWQMGLVDVGCFQMSVVHLRFDRVARSQRCVSSKVLWIFRVYGLNKTEVSNRYIQNNSAYQIIKRRVLHSLVLGYFWMF